MVFPQPHLTISKVRQAVVTDLLHVLGLSTSRTFGEQEKC